MSETRIHPETGKELRRDVQQQTVVVGSLSLTVDVPGWYPDDDCDAVHSGADLKTSNEAYQALRAQYTAHLRSVRKRLGLTQEEAGISSVEASGRSRNKRVAGDRRATLRSA